MLARVWPEYVFFVSPSRQRDAALVEKRALERKATTLSDKLKKAWEETEFLKQMNASLVANQVSWAETLLALISGSISTLHAHIHSWFICFSRARK